MVRQAVLPRMLAVTGQYVDLAIADNPFPPPAPLSSLTEHKRSTAATLPDDPSECPTRICSSFGQRALLFKKTDSISRRSAGVR